MLESRVTAGMYTLSSHTEQRHSIWYAAQVTEVPVFYKVAYSGTNYVCVTALRNECRKFYSAFDKSFTFFFFFSHII